MGEARQSSTLIRSAPAELDGIVTAQHETYEHIDDALRAFIGFAITYKRMHHFHSHGLEKRGGPA